MRSRVDRLWFPVKLGPSLRNVQRRLTAVLVGWGLVSQAACGYRTAYGGTPPSTRLAVSAAPSRSPESGALVAILAGLRGELSRAGVLDPGNGYPRVVVELVRIDERGTAQGLTTRPGDDRELPRAAGALVGVTARAWVELSESQLERDTGDVRRTAAFGSAANAGLDSARREAALDAAGYAVGEAIGRRVMGEIDVAQEPM